MTQLHPYLIVLSEKDRMVGNSSHFAERQPTVTSQQWEAGLRSTLAYLDASGLKTLVIADVPHEPDDVPTCLSRAAAHSWAPQNCGSTREEALNEDARKSEDAAVSAVHNAKLVDFVNKFCVGTVCKPVVAGQVVYRDSNHMTSGFARSLAPELEQEITALTEVPGVALRKTELLMGPRADPAH